MVFITFAIVLYNMNAKRSILTHDMNDIMVMIQVAQANVLKYTKSYLWVSYLWVILCIFVVENK